jgi:hypothetical protein
MSLSVTEDGIRKLVKEHSNRPDLLGKSLAEALKWQTSERTNKDLQDGVVVRGYIGAQPAAVFVVAFGPEKHKLLSTAALYAYHASIEWGLFVDAHEAVLFNSHWVLSNDWFTLPPFQWEALEQKRELLEVITPEGLTAGKIERVARQYREPDRLLLPVDDALVDRLDYWRDEVLRHSSKPHEIDEKLQTIFSQLFVLRAVEDRELAPGIGNLVDLCTSTGRVDLELLRMLFLRAKNEIESELFDFDVISAIPEFVLAGIIQDLYVPRDLPGTHHRYNFAWIDADVLGRAYEKYLSTLLIPVPITSSQLRFWDQPLREAARVSVQRSRGVYYTPPPLVRYLTEKCLEHVWPRFSDSANIPRIADFSCGSGSFLTAASDYLLRRLRERDPSQNWAHEIIKERHIVGIDIDSRAVTLARLSLWLRFAEEPHPLPLPRLKDVVVQADALGEEVWSSLPEDYDIVLGNPPFLAASRVQDRSDLALRYQTARGRFDYSYLFVELALRKLCQCGVLGMVVPNRLFRNRDASSLRELVTTSGNLLTAVDFGVTEVFEGATVYIGAIVVEKTSLGEDGAVRVIRVAKLSRFLGVLLMQADTNGSTIARDHLDAYDSTIAAGLYPWMLLSPADRKARIRISEDSQELASVAGVFQGIRSGANEIFVVDVVSGGAGGVLQVRNGLGDSAILEASLLRSVVYGADIGRYDSFSRVEENWQRRLIYPYLEKGVIPEAELREYYPGIYKYLRNYQGILADRTSIAGSGLQWYELVRRRDEGWLESKKLMTRDLAARTSFAADLEGAVFLLGGTAVVPQEPDHLLALLGYLNSSVANWYLAQVVPIFRAGFQKIEPQHLNALPVPSKILETGAWQDDLTSLVQDILQARASGNEAERESLELRVDQLICDLVGLKPAEIQ